MGASSTNTLLRTIEFCKKLNFDRRSAIGSYLEPALTSANTIMQTILGPPFAWRWNRVVTGFITTAGQQDYSLVNWSASLLVSKGWLTVDTGGNSQVVTTAGATGTTVPSWNLTTGGTTTDGNVTWTNLGPIGANNLSTNYTFGWVETASVQELTTSNTPKWYEMTSELCLALDSAQARPRYISPQGDNGNGVITFRLMPVPNAAYPVSVTIQQNPPLFTSLSQTWAPIPDEFAHLYTWGFLSLMWLFSDDPRFGTAKQQFTGRLISTSEGLTETQKNIFLHGWQQTTGQPIANADRLTQGYQARAV